LSQAMCSSAGMNAINHRRRARSHVAAQQSHGASGEAMAARATCETRVYVECARLGLSVVRSSALVGARTSLVAFFFTILTMC
jgi:hypothetical protein